jgi:hypothetical protein
MTIIQHHSAICRIRRPRRQLPLHPWRRRSAAKVVAAAEAVASRTISRAAVVFSPSLSAQIKCSRIHFHPLLPPRASCPRFRRPLCSRLCRRCHRHRLLSLPSLPPRHRHHHRHLRVPRLSLSTSTRRCTSRPKPNCASRYAPCCANPTSSLSRPSSQPLGARPPSQCCIRLVRSSAPAGSCERTAARNAAARAVCFCIWFVSICPPSDGPPFWSLSERGGDANARNAGVARRRCWIQSPMISSTRCGFRPKPMTTTIAMLTTLRSKPS